MNTGTTYTRVYLGRWGRVAHLCSDLNSQWPLCNVMNRYVWGIEPVVYGTGSQDETDRAAGLPTCRRCAAAVEVLRQHYALEQIRQRVPVYLRQRVAERVWRTLRDEAGVAYRDVDLETIVALTIDILSRNS